MNILQLDEKIKKGQFTIETCKHKCNPLPDMVEIQVIRALENYNKAKKLIESEDKDVLKEFAKHMVKNSPIVNSVIRDIIVSDIYCFDCGTRLSLYVLNQNEGILVPTEKFVELRLERAKEVGVNSYDYEFIPTIRDFKNFGVCEFSDSTYFESTLLIPSGVFCMANYFITTQLDEDVRPLYPMPHVEKLSYPRTKEQGSKGDLNCAIGRKQIQNEYAEGDIGYIQTGNSYYSFYLREDGKKIKISQDIFYKDGKELFVELEGYKKVCEISCGVWRLMFGDKKVLEGHNVDFSDYEKVDFNTIHQKEMHSISGPEIVGIDVEPGMWRYRNYIEHMKRGAFPLFAELELIE